MDANIIITYVRIRYFYAADQEKLEGKSIYVRGQSLSIQFL